MLVLLIALCTFGNACAADLPALMSLPPTTDQSALGRRGFLYVGGEYVGEGKTRLMRGQAYVEVLVPKRTRQLYPVVMIHGGAQTSTNFLQTPDGRAGWADFLLAHGYVVYLVDQPARGRSPYHESTDGQMFAISPSAAAHSFVAPERYQDYPQAKFHTQWPDGSAKSDSEGDPTFDAFYATQFESLQSEAETERLAAHAIDALLDRIGPAILLTHSQSGPIGWASADGRPALVKAILAVEPGGPPLENLGLGTTPPSKGRNYGVTDVPVAYDPPIQSAEQLVTVKQDAPDAPGLVKCIEQRSPARRLTNLQHIPVLMISAEASYHTQYDHCTAKYLTQAGVSVDFMRLADHGIKGNAHMMMLEKNNADIAGLIDAWIQKTVRRK